MFRAGCCASGSVRGSKATGRHGPVQARREAGLSGRRRVGDDAVEATGERARDRVRANLRVVHPVAAANREPRIAVRMPAEADARREIRRRVGQRLPVVAEAGVDRQVVAQADAVLHERDRHPLLQLVAGDAVADRLRVLLHVGQGPSCSNGAVVVLSIVNVPSTACPGSLPVPPDV